MKSYTYTVIISCWSGIIILRGEREGLASPTSTSALASFETYIKLVASACSTVLTDVCVSHRTELTSFRSSFEHTARYRYYVLPASHQYSVYILLVGNQ